MSLPFQNVIERQQREMPPRCDDEIISSIPAVDNGDELIDINTAGSQYVKMLQPGAVPFSGDMDHNAGLSHSSFIRKGLMLRLEAAVKNIQTLLARNQLVFMVVEGLRLDSEVDAQMANEHKSTGGCVSFRVFDEEINEFVDMGDHEVFTFSKNLTATQQHNRGSLLTACGYAGLINYPYEWWTFCFGTKYFCYYTGNKIAIYDTKKTV